MSEAHTKINKGTKTGADKAAEHLPALTRAYGRTLRAAGRRAAAKMRQTETVTAAADQQPPNWTPPPAGQLIDQQALADDTQAKTAKLHKQMLTASAQSALQPFDISFDIRAPTSQAMLDAVAQRIQIGITSAIQEQIQEAITSGYANGDSVDRVSRAIVAATDKISKVRADMLARTDLNALSNGGSLLAATISGAAETKTWLATEDERTRETHAEADGQTVGINDTFTIGGESAQYPGDPQLSDAESCNCRCSTVYGQPLTASAALKRFRDYLWEGSFDYELQPKRETVVHTPVMADGGPDVSNLAMIAVYPTLSEAKAIAVDGGQDPEGMHVTLVFLGDADSFDAQDARDAVAEISASMCALSGVVGGVGMFSEGLDGAPLIALPDVDGLTALREAVVQALGSRGIISPSEHGFLPHLTLNYVDPAEQSSMPLDCAGSPLTFTSLSLTIAGQRSDYALTGVAHSPDGAITSGGNMTDTLAATGDTGLPLSERDRAWDSGEATGRVKKWASSDGSGDADKIDYSKLARAYFWQDPAGDGGAKIGDFKLPFADIVGGKLTAIWRGITAGAQRLSQTQGIDKGAVQKKMSAYYSKASKAFDDPSIKPPWASGSASVDGERLATVRAYLADNGADIIDDDELRAIILVSEALSLSPQSTPLRASLTDFALLAPAVEGGTPWTATLCVAGVPTVDSGIKRILSPEGGSWLPLPLPLAIMDDSPHADMVTSSPICGRIDSIAVAGDVYQASGVFFDDSDDPDVAASGSRAAAIVGEMRRMGISVDLVDCDVEMKVYDSSSVTDMNDMLDDANDPVGDIDAPGGPATEANFPTDVPMDDGMIGDVDDLEYVMCFNQWVIAGATICPVQALTQATISLVASAFSRKTEWRSEAEFSLPALTAAAAGLVPLEPPADWFNDPELDGPTPLTVTDEGRVFGHLATWDTCHTGLPGCVPPPRSPTGYMNFHLGEIKAEGGERVSVGTLSFDKGHASHRLNADRTVAHYDDTTTAGAHVRAGEDQFGIWLAGALNPRLSAEDARVLMAAPPSGDWRQVRQGEGRDLVGALAVNVPGFPVPRERKGLSLQASAVCDPCEEDFSRQLQVLAASADGIEGLAQLIA